MNQLASIIVSASRRFPCAFGFAFRFAVFAVSLFVGLGGTVRAQSQKGGVPSLEQRVAVLEELVLSFNAQKNQLQAQVAVLQAQVAALQATLAPVKRVGNDVIFEGCNVYVRSGSGRTDGALNGLGNLVVGYNEGGGPQSRMGSHNLVVGSYHSYRSYGGLVAGYANDVGAPFANVTGGRNNHAIGPYASVSAGNTNTASGVDSSVSGGYYNLASGEFGTVSGGWEATATEKYMWGAGGFYSTYH